MEIGCVLDDWEEFVKDMTQTKSPSAIRKSNLERKDHDSRKLFKVLNLRLFYSLKFHELFSKYSQLLR